MSGTAHKGTVFSSLSIEQGVILPVDFQDTLLPFHWNTTTRGIFPIQDITTVVPDSKFNQAIAIEDSTINIILSPSILDISKWGSYGFSDGGNETKISAFPKGALYNTNALKVERLASSANLTAVTTWFSPNLTLAPGEKATVSIYARASAQAVGKTLALHIYGNKVDGTNFSVTADPVGSTILESQWKRHVAILTNTDTQNWTITNFYTRGDVGTALPIGEFYLLSAPQIEKKDYASSFVDGVRGNGVLSFPKYFLPEKTFTVNTWVNLNTKSETTYQPIFELTHGSQSLNRLLFMLEVNTSPYNKKPELWFSDSTSSSKVNTSAPIVNAREWMMATATFNGTTYKVYYNGQLIGSSTGNPVVLDPTAVLYIGGTYYGKLNGQLSNFLICPREAPAEEIQAWYEYSRPFYDPYDYTAVYA